MRRIAGALLGATLLALFPARAGAQTEADEEKVDVGVPNISTDLLDPSGYSRFHLATRMTFGDGKSAFTSDSSWSYEARVHVRIIEGLALSATLPFGLRTFSDPMLGNQFFFGNFNVGVAGGGALRLAEGGKTAPRMRIGGAFEIYAPTAPKPRLDDPLPAVAQLSVAGIRSLEPFLYIGNLMSFRTRFHADVSVSVINAAFELGLTPSFTVDSSSDFLMWLGVAARIGALPIPELEPFVEMGSAIQIAGPGDISPPFLLTPGVRFHFWTVDPAISVSFNFKESSVIIFGIDLAGVVRPATRSETHVSDEDFMDDF